MADNTGGWKDHGQTDSEFTREPCTDPLAELAADLALCVLYLEEGKGSFCDYCTCSLGFHCTTEDGECELCTCYAAHLTKRLEIPAAKMVPARRGLDIEHLSRFKDIEVEDDYDRAKEARKVLKDLSD